MTAIKSQELFLSRRWFYAVIALLPMTVMMKDPTDGILISLGQTFERLAKEIDGAIAGEHELSEVTLRDLGAITDTIAATPARTSLGLRVKARAACWALLGDLDGPDQGTLDETMARSIVRDLVRNFDPELENKGALRRLAATS